MDTCSFTVYDDHCFIMDVQLLHKGHFFVELAIPVGLSRAQCFPTGLILDHQIR